jgi:hypothetical protein
MTPALDLMVVSPLGCVPELVLQQVLLLKLFSEKALEMEREMQ